VLHDFAGEPTDGINPWGSLVIGVGGVLYGITHQGGYPGGIAGLGVGTVYSLTPPASPQGSWTETLLHKFTGPPSDGSYPAGLVMGTDGKLYGTTFQGGDSHLGTVFELQP
jgi:uncharacterized repeat protein (TIGR03803 family)